MSGPRLTSTLTCPACGSQEKRDMPMDACVYFHRCIGRGVTSKPRPGDSCVSCSFGDTHSGAYDFRQTAISSDLTAILG